MDNFDVSCYENYISYICHGRKIREKKVATYVFSIFVFAVFEVFGVVFSLFIQKRATYVMIEQKRSKISEMESKTTKYAVVFRPHEFFDLRFWRVADVNLGPCCCFMIKKALMHLGFMRILTIFCHRL